MSLYWLYRSGHEIIRHSPNKNLKRITLELSGKSANSIEVNLINDDADLDVAITQSQVDIYNNQGQCGIAGSRVFFHEKIYDKFVTKSFEASNSGMSVTH
jgi:acyl-CoA reductase-like NAD-dependent aldehyde dehydrogenase